VNSNDLRTLFLTEKVASHLSSQPRRSLNQLGQLEHSTAERAVAGGPLRVVLICSGMLACAAPVTAQSARPGVNVEHRTTSLSRKQTLRRRPQPLGKTVPSILANTEVPPDTPVVGRCLRALAQPGANPGTGSDLRSRMRSRRRMPPSVHGLKLRAAAISLVTASQAGLVTPIV